MQGIEAAKAASEAAEAAVAAEQEAVEELRGRAAKLDAEVAELRKAAVKQNDAGGLPQICGCCLPNRLLFCSSVDAAVRASIMNWNEVDHHHLSTASWINNGC